MNADVNIDGIIMFCDESVLGLHIGNGYSVEKVYVEDISYKDRITDGRGQLAIPYFGSAKVDGNGKYLFCLKKEVVYQMQPPQHIVPGVYTGEQLRCDDQVDEFNHGEIQYLHKIFSLLHIFKAGNIGVKQVFFEHKFSYGLINNTIRRVTDNVTRNIVDDRIFSLADSEILACNRFLDDYSGQEYDLLKRSIDKFVQGLTPVDHSVGFEQFTTALEMTLLDRNQPGKKEVLSKRVAVLLEDKSVDIFALYDKMKGFYRYRSESLHEGAIHNISETERFDLENIVRRVLNKCLQRCKAELVLNVAVTWDMLKDKLINELKAKVTTESNLGTF